MKVCALCTGNVARSPAMEALLRLYRPDLQVSSAALGRNAEPGRRMARPMRERLTNIGLGDFAEAHRSKLYVHLAERPDILIVFQPSHILRLQELRVELPYFMASIKDPAFGGEAAYDVAWEKLIIAAMDLAARISRGDK